MSVNRVKCLTEQSSFPNLEILIIDNQRLTNNVVGSLKGLNYIKHMVLNACYIAPDFCMGLQIFKYLEKLWIFDTVSHDLTKLPLYLKELKISIRNLATTRLKVTANSCTQLECLEVKCAPDYKSQIEVLPSKPCLKILVLDAKEGQVMLNEVAGSKSLSELRHIWIRPDSNLLSHILLVNNRGIMPFSRCPEGAEIHYLDEPAKPEETSS